MTFLEDGVAADVAREGAEHRAMYAEELRLRKMTSYQRGGHHLVLPDTEPIVIDEALVEVTDSGPLGGAPFSRDLNRRLGDPAAYGERFPWAHSWFYLRVACRRDHPGHTERPLFGGSLCWQTVSYYVIAQYEPDTISRLMDIPVESVERHLLRAFGWLIEDMDRKQRIRNARDPAPPEEPSPSRLSLLQCDAVTRAVEDFDMEERIWNSQREIQARHGLELPTWEEEWARRQSDLIDHRLQCDRCRRAA